MNLSQRLIESTSIKVRAEDFKSSSKVKGRDFSRKRKLSFEELILFMLMNFKSTAQSALRRLFKDIGRAVFMRQQSLSEARYKIRHEAFIELFRLTVEPMLEECQKKWHGYRLLAIDGSKINLPSDASLREYFGGNSVGAKTPQAQGSIFYDVLNDIVLDADIAPLSTCERRLAHNHITACSELLRDQKKIVICDRGYASFALIEKLTGQGFHYLMRVRKKFNLDIDAQTTLDGFVKLSQNGKQMQVRVIKFTLDSGEEEVLITNITDKRLGRKAFKKLYFMRWSVETKYDMVKNKLQLENFSARLPEGIKQDFFATMYLANMVASLKYDAQAKLDSILKHSDNKHSYKVNTNELIGVLKDRFVLAFTLDDTDMQMKVVQSIVDEIALFIVPVRPQRCVLRNHMTRRAKWHFNKKSNC